MLRIANVFNKSLKNLETLKGYGKGNKKYQEIISSYKYILRRITNRNITLDVLIILLVIIFVQNCIMIYNANSRGNFTAEYSVLKIVTIVSFFAIVFGLKSRKYFIIQDNDVEYINSVLFDYTKYKEKLGYSYVGSSIVAVKYCNDAYVVCLNRDIDSDYLEFYVCTAIDRSGDLFITLKAVDEDLVSNITCLGKVTDEFISSIEWVKEGK